MMADLKWHDFDQKRHFKKSIVHPTLKLNVIHSTIKPAYSNIQRKIIFCSRPIRH